MRLTVFIVVMFAACEPAPETTNQYFSWQESVTDMRSALLGACASNDGKVYAVGGPFGQAALYRWTSRRWLQEGSMLQGERLWSCWAGAHDRLIAVGQDGAIFRHNAEGWHQDEVPAEAAGANLYGVWGMPDGTAVAVGGDLPSPSETSVILHFDGSEWTRMDSSSVRTKTLQGVWGSGPNDYWAVGYDGAIAHFDGDTWKPQTSQVSDRLFAIHGSSDTDIYAVGGSGRGLILRWNGSSWLEFDKHEHALRSAWTTKGQPLFVGGYGGYVARYGRGESIPSATRLTEATPFPHLRINGLVGLGSAVLGVASTTEVDDETGDWRGSVVAHGRSFAGPIFESARPDAGLPDARLPDAGL